MPYIGNTIRAADDYRLIDDISSGFNGSTTSFALQVAGSAPVPFPKSPQQVLISVNGVIQEPDPTGASGFNLVGTNIVFSSAPTNGHAFFGIIYATADYLNAGGNFPAGSLGAPSITFIGDENSGLFRKSGGSVGFVSDATEIANFDSNGITISSGNLIIPDSIIHNGDANTKIRFPAVDTVTIETAGSERLRVDSSGNVGIGTTGPARNLEVKGASGDPVHFKLEGDPADYARIMFADGTDDNIGEIRYNFGSDFMSFTANATERMRIDSSGNVGIGTTSPSRKLHVSGDILGSAFMLASNTSPSPSIQAQIYRVADNTLAFATNGSNERMRIDSSGRVGIGTTNMGAYNGGFDNFVIRGSGNTGMTISTDDNSFGQIAFSNAEDAHVSGAIQYRNSDNILELRAGESNGAVIFSTVSNTERMRIDSSGDMILGSTSSLGRLTVSKAQNNTSDGTFTNPHIRLNASSTTNTTGFTGIAYSVSTLSNYGWTAGAQRIASGTTGAFVFRFHNNSATGTERMRIDSDGRVHVGTSTGVGGGSAGVRFQNPDVGTSRFGTTITSGTKTLIQFISNNANNIVGSISVATSTTSFNTSSDYRLKENESLISDGITRLKQLKPYRFNWKSDSSTIVDGFFAHEVSSIVPESITGTKDAVAVQEDVDKGIADAIGESIYQSIDHSKLVPLLTAALQEEIAKREALETRVATLESA